VNIVYLAPFAFSPKATVSARMLPIATALVRHGHRVTILIPPYDNPADAGKCWEVEGVRLENVAGGGFSLLRMAQQMAARVRELQPDVLHVFKPVGPGALAMWLLLRTAPRYVTKVGNVIVDNDDWEGKGGWLDVNPYPSYQKWVLAWQERWALQHAGLITCASHTLAARSRELVNLLQPTPFLAMKPIIVLPNGPDASLREQVRAAELKRAALREQFGWAGQHIAIYAGTVPHGHDMDVAVRAVQTVRTSAAGKLRWVIIATGDGLPTLRESVSEAGLDNMVEWHSFMPHAQLVERLVAADVALYPYRDTNINRAKCSGKVIDYMACAKPMVVSDVGMNRVYLENGMSGRLTPPGDAEAFASALQELLASPEAAERMGRAAQTHLWQHFGWEARVSELERIYSA